MDASHQPSVTRYNSLSIPIIDFGPLHPCPSKVFPHRLCVSVRVYPRKRSAMVPTYLALKTIYRIVMVSTKIEIQVWKWTHRDAVSSPGSSGLKIPLSTLHTALNTVRYVALPWSPFSRRSQISRFGSVPLNHRLVVICIDVSGAGIIILSWGF